MATGLETSGLPVRVIRPGENPPFDPNFHLVGDVLQHRHTAVPTSKPKDSKYRAGEQAMPNDDWNKTNREYESALLDLQRAQGALQGATSHGKKKEITEANNQYSAAQKKVEEARAKLDTIPNEIQFFTDVENMTRDLLLKAFRESVAKFPNKIFKQARKRAERGDMDGTAESYMLHLNSTSAEH